MDVNRLMSVQSMMKMGIDFCPNFVQPFLENIDRRCCYDGSREPKIITLSSNLGLPCKCALLGRVEQEGGKISLDQYPMNIPREYLEGGNEVSPKSSPLQGIKAQPLQSFFVVEMTKKNRQGRSH